MIALAPLNPETNLSLSCQATCEAVDAQCDMEAGEGVAVWGADVDLAQDYLVPTFRSQLEQRFPLDPQRPLSEEPSDQILLSNQDHLFVSDARMQNKPAPLGHENSR